MCMGSGRRGVHVGASRVFRQLMSLMMLLRVYPFVLFQVLRALERLSADRARVGLQWRVNCVVSSSRALRMRVTARLTSEMTGDVIPLDTLDPTALPSASQTEIVGTLPPHMLVTQVVVQLVWPARHVCAAHPLTGDRIGVIVVLCGLGMRYPRSLTEGRSDGSGRGRRAGRG